MKLDRTEPARSAPDNDPFHAAINAKLSDIVASATTPPDWYEAWQSLGPDASEEQRLKVYQAIRDADVLPAEAGFYLVSWQIDAMTSLLAEVTLHEMDEELSAIQEAYGLQEGGFWPPDEAPEEYTELHGRYMQAWDKLFVEQLEHHGEHEMAELFQTDPDAFEQCAKQGQQHFHASDDPDHWLDELGDAVASILTANSVTGSLGFRYCEQDGCWIVVVYLQPVKLAGGAEDGEVVAPDFSLDLEELRRLFERVDACSWRAIGLNYEEGPHVSIEGRYQGHEVFLQVLAYAPIDEEPGEIEETE